MSANIVKRGPTCPFASSEIAHGDSVVSGAGVHVWPGGGSVIVHWYSGDDSYQVHTTEDRIAERYELVRVAVGGPELGAVLRAIGECKAALAAEAA